MLGFLLSSLFIMALVVTWFRTGACRLHRRAPRMSQGGNNVRSTQSVGGWSRRVRAQRAWSSRLADPQHASPDSARRAAKDSPSAQARGKPAGSATVLLPGFEVRRRAGFPGSSARGDGRCV